MIFNLSLCDGPVWLVCIKMAFLTCSAILFIPHFLNQLGIIMIHDWIGDFKVKNDHHLWERFQPHTSYGGRDAVLVTGDLSSSCTFTMPRSCMAVTWSMIVSHFVMKVNPNSFTILLLSNSGFTSTVCLQNYIDSGWNSTQMNFIIVRQSLILDATRRKLWPHQE